MGPFHRVNVVHAWVLQMRCKSGLWQGAHRVLPKPLFCYLDCVLGVVVPLKSWSTLSYRMSLYIAALLSPQYNAALTMLHCSDARLWALAGLLQMWHLAFKQKNVNLCFITPENFVSRSLRGFQVSFAHPLQMLSIHTKGIISRNSKRVPLSNMWLAVVCLLLRTGHYTKQARLVDWLKPDSTLIPQVAQAAT